MNEAPVFLGRDERVPGYKLLASGKVRDIYEIDAQRLLFVTTDRVSAPTRLLAASGCKAWP